MDDRRDGLRFQDAGAGAGDAGKGHARVLLADDDDDVVALLSRYLGGHGYSVASAGSGAAVRRALREAPPDIVLLDLGLPDEDGLSLLQHLRDAWRGPVIVVSGRGDAVERVVGLELGADDYVAKPFDLRELLARIRSVLRRSGGAPPAATGADADAPPAAAPRLRFDRFELDTGARRLRDGDGAEVSITTGDYALLMALLAQPHRVLTRDQLMQALHGREPGPYDRAIDVAVARLRRRIERDPASPVLIRSVRGAGYLFAATVERH